MLHKLTNYRPVSISFCNEVPSDCPITDDEVSECIAQAAKNGQNLAINCRRGRFSAGSYFAERGEIPVEEIIDVYVNKECVFKDKEIAREFLCRVGRNPVECSHIRFSSGFDQNADVVLLVVNVSQASRVLGLSCYEGNFKVDLVPAAPTCASLFRPLIEPECIHVNLIDYFDRDYQAKGKFGEGELIVSMRPGVYKEMAHRSIKPDGLPVY